MCLRRMKTFSKSLSYSVAELEPESDTAYFQGQKNIKTAEALKVGKSGFKPWFCVFQLWDWA